MSSYTGLYVQRLSNGVIFGVQVLDTAGMENSLDPVVYQQRGIQPPIERLPDLEDYSNNGVLSCKFSEKAYYCAQEGLRKSAQPLSFTLAVFLYDHCPRITRST
jgi:hypothetical protein